MRKLIAVLVAACLALGGCGLIPMTTTCPPVKTTHTQKPTETAVIASPSVQGTAAPSVPADSVNMHRELDIGGVTGVEIVTVTENVTLTAGSGTTLAANLTGTCTGGEASLALNAGIAGGKLRIEVKTLASLTARNTKLAVTIPETYKGNMAVTTISGDILADGLPLRLGSVYLRSTSGDVRFGAASYAYLNAQTTSGSIAISGIAALTDITSTSGDVMLDYTAMAVTSVRTTSSDVTAAIPEGLRFAVDFSSVSGSISSTYPGLTASGKHSFTGGVSESPVITIRTTSGDFVLKSR